MTHIICRALNCLFWEDGICGAEEIEYEPDAGCLTFQDVGDLEIEEEEEEFIWDDEEEDDLLDEDEDWDEEEDDEDAVDAWEDF